MADESAWKEVDHYAQKRRNDRGDVFGWMPAEDKKDVAVILAAETSEEATFPREISGIRLVVKKISTPEKQA